MSLTLSRQQKKKKQKEKQGLKISLKSIFFIFLNITEKMLSGYAVKA